MLVDGTLRALGAWMDSAQWILDTWILVTIVSVSTPRGLGSILVVRLIRWRRALKVFFNVKADDGRKRCEVFH